jgi:predicted glutamine amidotransferase
MARLIGYMANRADRLRDAFHQERHAISGLPADTRGAWGVGFYQGDEVLHKKQPTPDGEPVDWTAIAQNVRTDCCIAHVRQATVGGFSVDNTHPFRLRQWLFAHVGTISRFDEVQEKLRAELPDFLRRNIRGTSDSELFFHQVLAQLHGKNQLEAAAPAHATVLDAITEAVARIDGLVGSEGPRSTLNMMLSNGRSMYALRHGGPLGYVVRAGLREPLVPEDDRPRPGSPQLRYVMLVAGGHEVPSDYVAAQDGEVIYVSRDLEVLTHKPS